ncbi:hypothetical protein FKM82_010518 [Ascaphus truei]
MLLEFSLFWSLGEIVPFISAVLPRATSQEMCASSVLVMLRFPLFIGLPILSIFLSRQCWDVTWAPVVSLWQSHSMVPSPQLRCF